MAPENDWVGNKTEVMGALKVTKNAHLAVSENILARHGMTLI